MGSGSVVRMPPPDYQAATANGSEPSCPPPAYPEVVINIEQGSNDAPAATAATETATEPTYFIQEHSLGSSKCQKCCDRLVVALEKCAAPFVRFRETKIGHPFAIVAIIIGRAFYYFLWIPIACLFWVIGCLIVGLLVFMLYPFAALPLAAARLLYPPAFKEPQGRFKRIIDFIDKQEILYGIWVFFMIPALIGCGLLATIIVLCVLYGGWNKKKP